MELQPVARVRRDERAPAAVLLHAQVALLRARESCDEVVLVEREPEVVDARQLPLSRLHDDVDGAALQLGQPQLEPHRGRGRPSRSPASNEVVLLADAAVPGDELEAELADVARLDLPHLARHEVVMEEMHAAD